MDPKKGCSVTMVAAEEGYYSIPITQRPSDQGRLRAEYDPVAAILSGACPIIHSSIAEGKNHNMKRMNPCDKEV